MQITGANLIAAQAAQQAARARPPMAPPPKPAETASFQPLSFAKTGPSAAPPQGAIQRPGGRLDITV